MMTQGWTVWCEADEGKTDGRVCCAMDQVSGTKRKAAELFRASGWRMKRGIGWICPACANKTKGRTE